ncbi:CAP domain-containing protein [Anatilimnocola floriformis]|uniref:CAP domain-containing protein n=1 Tax=Anatilimnocola floriformis TaxID=2948575 RepID=UPI0020C514C0|nr:CAP domain-containing protein [Anatilimnocola floriformis]
MNTSPTIRLALIIVFTAITTASARAENGKPDSDKTRADLLKLHNRERREDGEKPLKLNSKLSEAAQEYAEYLAKSGEFSHSAKGTMSSRVKDAGYKPRAVGENIAVGQKSTSSVLKSWMHSEGHKKNILSDKYSEVGFGIAKDKKGRLLWVTDFGDR